MMPNRLARTVCVGTRVSIDLTASWAETDLQCSVYRTLQDQEFGDEKLSSAS